MREENSENILQGSAAAHLWREMLPNHPDRHLGPVPERWLPSDQVRDSPLRHRDDVPADRDHKEERGLVAVEDDAGATRFPGTARRGKRVSRKYKDDDYVYSDDNNDQDGLSVSLGSAVDKRSDASDAMSTGHSRKEAKVPRQAQTGRPNNAELDTWQMRIILRCAAVHNWFEAPHRHIRDTKEKCKGAIEEKIRNSRMNGMEDFRISIARMEGVVNKVLDQLEKFFGNDIRLGILSGTTPKCKIRLTCC